jgi:hypothetical protein
MEGRVFGRLHDFNTLELLSCRVSLLQGWVDGYIAWSGGLTHRVIGQAA